MKHSKIITISAKITKVITKVITSSDCTSSDFYLVDNDNKGEYLTACEYAATTKKR